MKCIVVILMLAFSSLAQAAPMRWDDVRDGTLYLQPGRDDTLRISWVPAWQTDANEERIYLLDGQGAVARRAFYSRQRR